MPFDRPQQRTTRRRSSAGPTPPRRPAPIGYDKNGPQRQGGPRPTFLALKDHGKVFVADMPFLADGQLANISKEAAEVLVSLERRITELEQMQGDRDTLIKACTKRDVTHRFLRAIEDEQQQRRDNPAIRMAAGESLPRTFLEIARHRLPGATFDSLLQEALTACENSADQAVKDEKPPLKVVSLQPQASSLPVVVSPDPEPSDQAL
ncbi:histidine phosphotransferase [Synechococcus sp. NOUM97013]|uniref:histidine phosphotransferase n=1 Tax=Synechococcus sp. NOUM97013 TaxID=1442555 RepID=UPI001647649E|nr:histidine phosphotransferase [Synechococcus sp. NOUM97013]